MNWRISNTSHFKTQYRLLPHHIQTLAKGVFELLEEGPYHEHLRLHKLRKPLSNYHSLSINGDYRIICRIIESEQTIVLHDVGTHEIYRNFSA